jgi:bifunctional DNA-binding transcriptional regulator/antitoxin component of YhaV-PrlF toxin-antitoxin module
MKVQGKKNGSLYVYLPKEDATYLGIKKGDMVGFRSRGEELVLFKRKKVRS